MNRNRKWKILFFLLLGINIAFIMILFLFVLIPAKEEPHPDNFEKNRENKVSFDFSTNKSDLTKVINYYIEQGTKESTIDYEVLLEDEVELYGTIEVFLQEIELKVTFEPQALENGDLLLKQSSMTIGSLPLPVEYVLKFVKEQYDLPVWVVIQPEERNIYVSLQEMKLQSGIQIRAKHFDLRNDDISFTLLVPGKGGK